ncbi:conserved hypothetical protein [Ricinus communis]|uniref:Uncharacterized protein n=1 Tax=Ricinus communis TaxID=3988 RepID=B9SJ34_RICCO|nr:conserved hypothetical protein [Ricinus communis]
MGRGGRASSICPSTRLRIRIRIRSLSKHMRVGLQKDIGTNCEGKGSKRKYVGQSRVQWGEGESAMEGSEWRRRLFARF